MKILSTYLWLLFVFIPMVANAADKPASNKKQTIENLYLTAKEAYALKQSYGNKALFIDVRTPEELIFVGSAGTMDINIPFNTLDYAHWDDKHHGFRKVENQQFVDLVDKAIRDRSLSKDSSIILMCRSGSRSAKAANKLAAKGYRKVYTVIDGFEGDKQKKGKLKGKRVVNGWKNADLPWSYHLEKGQLAGLK